MFNDKLEEEERDKYNYLVEAHSYGSDYRRETQIARMCNELGKISVLYKELLLGYQHKDPQNKDKCMKVLDIGSGPGGVMSWLATNYNADVYGVDISDKLAGKLKQNFPELAEKVQVCNAKDLSIFEDNTFDLVQHCDGMEHIPMEWEVDCLKEAVRTTKRYVFYETATGNATADAWARGRGYTYDAAHINIKSADQWQAFYEAHAADLGYDIRETHYAAGTFATILEKR